MTTGELFDVKTLAREGLLEKTARGYPGLGFCEMMDMKVAGAVIRGTLDPNPPVDLHKGEERYELVDTAQQCFNALTHSAVDDPVRDKDRCECADHQGGPCSFCLEAKYKI